MKNLVVLLLAFSISLTSCASSSHSMGQDGYILDLESQNRYQAFVRQKERQDKSNATTGLIILASAALIVGAVAVHNKEQKKKKKSKTAESSRNYNRRNYYNQRSRSCDNDNDININFYSTIPDSDQNSSTRSFSPPQRSYPAQAEFRTLELLDSNARYYNEKSLEEMRVQVVRLKNPYSEWVVGDLVTNEYSRGTLKKVAIAPKSTLIMYLPKGIGYTYNYHLGKQEEEYRYKNYFIVRDSPRVILDAVLLQD
ncbi:hypothetical protein [Sediminitomix flava]|uniref:DUF3824 domain-containing protein n=1 Tax=Sediminitomix flava TaxID=379075 RepID=A0A315Z806_SEDFL|nr:hypothetical protein [Sediminitomix flava]PWJ41061.1 hypothetical protein BC781_104336 [Sediminitomix flava]